MPQYQRKVKSGLKWWNKLSFEGKLYHSNAIYLTKNEAKRAEAEHLALLDRKRRNPRQKPVLSLLDAINERLDNVQVRKSHNYYKENKRSYAKLIEHFGDIQITEITKKDIHEFLLNVSKEARQQGKDNYSVNAMLSIYKVLFNYAIDNHDLNMRNPCSGIKLFPVHKKFKYIPSDEDIEAVIHLCSDRQRLLIEFVKATGARISEALRVTGNDLTSDNVILYTMKSANSNLTPRKLPIPECIKENKVNGNERIFPEWVEKPKFLERKVRELKQRRWNWHSLRHRRASLWSKEGLPIFEIMLKLGHSNLKTTQGYLQLLP